MEKMDVDDAVVDLSISHSRLFVSQQQQHSINNSITNSSQASINTRRVLRPRTEPRSYVESPDVIINGTLDKPRTNGNVDYSSDSSEGEMPPLAPIKELSPAELQQRERGIRRLREELRAEEMKLVLLKKLKQSQQLKENVAVIPPSIPPSALPPTGLPSGLSITPTTVKVPTNKIQQPPTAHSRHSNMQKPGHSNITSLMRGQLPPPRSSMHAPPSSASPLSNRAANLSVPQPPQRSSLNRNSSGFPPGIKDLSPSVTITPAPPQSQKIGNGADGKSIAINSLTQSASLCSEQDRLGGDSQTPAQRQAAAKLALRKQLEKTLLQIPPPKPPPPEMHFIPNPSNTEFIYLVGLEHVVDFLTKETKTTPPSNPLLCNQCNSDFTPVWKWETKGKNNRNRDLRVVCEQCVTTNVKKALKAEHTNRLKTAFVKALQQEQEIEQRMAQNGGYIASNSPAPSPATPEAIVPKSVTPQPTPRHAPTPPAPPSAQQTPPPSRSSHSQDKYIQNAAAMQALHQQLVRTLQSGGPPAAHMLQFSPLFYPYQLAMAQAATNKSGTPNLVDLQRAADLQRQYLLDMIPSQTGQRHNWKT